MWFVLVPFAYSSCLETQESPVNFGDSIRTRNEGPFYPQTKNKIDFAQTIDLGDVKIADFNRRSGDRNRP